MPGLFWQRHKKMRTTRVSQCITDADGTKMIEDNDEAFTLIDLPNDILFLLFSRLSLTDLLTLREVSQYFLDFIDCSPTLWSSCSMDDMWPDLSNLHFIQKAASHGNLAALIKLGIAYLYNDGIYNRGKNSINLKEEETLEDFIQAEILSHADYPFTWIFYRPPWSAVGMCAKSKIFDALMDKATKNECDKTVYFCIGRTLLFFEKDLEKDDATTWFRKAAEKGCANSAYYLWLQKYQNNHDKALLLENIRMLRDIVLLNPKCTKAHLALCLSYAKGNFGGISHSAATSFTCQMFQSSTPTNIHYIVAKNRSIPCQVRQILLDWIIEVIGMKSFSEEILHLTVRTIDRCLIANHIPKTQLQLLGITALLLCARFLGKEILTIREAAWITDNTYKYEEVVQMMGQIVTILRGNLLVFTVLDYLQLLLELEWFSEKMKWMAHFLTTFSLLHSEMGQFPQSLVASACYVLANAALENRNFWPNTFKEFTGYDIQNILPCLILLHHQTLHIEEIVDLRCKTLDAIKLRYLGEKYGGVSEIELPSMNDFQELFGVEPTYYQQIVLTYTDGITYSAREEKLKNEMDKSTCSGYEGDDEDDLISGKRFKATENNCEENANKIHTESNEDHFNESLDKEENIATNSTTNDNENCKTTSLNGIQLISSQCNTENNIKSNDLIQKNQLTTDPPRSSPIGEHSLQTAHSSKENSPYSETKEKLQSRVIPSSSNIINISTADKKNPHVTKQVLGDISNRQVSLDNSLKDVFVHQESSITKDTAKS